MVRDINYRVNYEEEPFPATWSHIRPSRLVPTIQLSTTAAAIGFAPHEVKYDLPIETLLGEERLQVGKSTGSQHDEGPSEVAESNTRRSMCFTERARNAAPASALAPTQANRCVRGSDS
jgi:hypothetical protein